ncbi:MAG: tyrosine-protein phosphatase [Myxococcales bacterium]|nr:MAG: tyrosine-protein phosphatase [Myxococcales bacterium]
MLPPIHRAVCCVLLALGCSSGPAELAGAAGAPPARQRAKPSLTPAKVADPEPAESAGGALGSGGAPAEPTEPTDVSCERSQFVLRPDVSNARDLGGVPLASGAVACGAVFRGPPLRLSEEGCQELTSLGIRTVVDLRTEGERLGSPQSECVAASVVPAPLPVPYGLGPEDYLRDLNTDESVAKVFHTFGDPEAYPIYFHCTYGRDRTGVIGALLLLTLGATRQTVMDEYLLSAPNVGAYPDALEAVLSEVEARGGPTQTLLDLGITEDELAVLRARAVAE